MTPILRLLPDVARMVNRTYMVNNLLHTHLTPDEIAQTFPDDVVLVMEAQWRRLHPPKE